MWFLRKFSVRGRLIISHGLLLILIVLISLFSNSCLTTVNDNFTTLLSTSVVANSAVKDIRIEVNNAASSLEMLIISNDNQTEETYFTSIQNNLSQVQSNADTLKNHIQLVMVLKLRILL